MFCGQEKNTRNNINFNNYYKLKGETTMSFYAHKSNNKKIHITEAEQQRRLEALKRDKRSSFANKDWYIPISLRRMPRPKGKIYKDWKRGSKSLLPLLVFILFPINHGCNSIYFFFNK